MGRYLRIMLVESTCCWVNNTEHLSEMGICTLNGSALAFFPPRRHSSIRYFELIFELNIFRVLTTPPSLHPEQP